LCNFADITPARATVSRLPRQAAGTLAASVKQKQHLTYTYDNEARPAKPLEQGKVSVEEQT